MTIDEINEINPEALICEGFDSAIIGMAERINLGPVVAYDVDKIISILMERDGMDMTEAIEYYNFNILGSWMGEYTPVFISKNNL